MHVLSSIKERYAVTPQPHRTSDAPCTDARSQGFCLGRDVEVSRSAANKTDPACEPNPRRQTFAHLRNEPRIAVDCP